MTKIKFLLVIATVNGQPYGNPEITPLIGFETRQKQVADQTGGNAGFIVLAEITEELQVISRTVSDCDNRLCTFYRHYQLNYTPESGARLEHEAYHAAEEKCAEAQKNYTDYIDNPKNAGTSIPGFLEEQASFWEKRICA